MLDVSLHETPLTRRYWDAVGGTLYEEFLVVRRRPGVGQRVVDAIIVLGEDRRIADRGERVDLEDKDVIVVQTKGQRVGMYLLGQAFFSRVLVEERFSPRSVRTVALCAADDDVLGPIAERFGIEVVVDTPPNVIR
jgi:hypothetical protein